MKVASRLAMGYAFLLVLLAGLLIYPITTLHKMQEVNRQNSGVNFRIAADALQLMRDRDNVEEFARKYFAGPSADLQAQLSAARESFDASIAGIRGISLLERQQTEIERLSRFWKECGEALSRLLPQLPNRAAPQPTARPAQFPAELEEQFERLRAQSFTLYQAAVRTISLEAERAGIAGGRAEFALWVSAGSGFVLGLIVAAFIVRSISAPLRLLAQGTRAFTEGKAFYRLDTSGKDEFSQIARDFNDLARRVYPDQK